MPDKSAELPESNPLARLLAIGSRAHVLSSVLGRKDMTQHTFQYAAVTLAGLLIDLSAVVVDVYGEQQLARLLRCEAVSP